MTRLKCCLIFLLLSSALFIPINSTCAFTADPFLENTSIFGYDQETEITGYNRLRLNVTLEEESLPLWSGSIIIDNNTLYTQIDDSLQNKTRIYRAHLDYTGDRHRFVMGLQRIPLGVGRIWNPIDVFNPIDSLRIEPEEREGTEALHYEYGFSALSNLDCTVSKDKGALRVKGFLDYGDAAVVTIYDDEQQQTIIGWELSGELPDTGIELRSEGGIFYTEEDNSYKPSFIIGAEYGFASSLTLLLEYYYNESPEPEQLGGIATYQYSPLVYLQLLVITSLGDGSTFTSPSLFYSLSDDMTLSAGVAVYMGNEDELYGQPADRVYLHWFVHF